MADHHADRAPGPRRRYGADDAARRLRATLWGAGRLSWPLPNWLFVQGALIAVIATAALVGMGAASAYSPAQVFRDGSAGVVFCLAFAIFLWSLRAGRVFIGALLAIGVAVASLTPQMAAQAVLDHRGERLTAVVTDVSPAAAREEPGKRFCSVSQVPGPVAAPRIWRGCTPGTLPGDEIALVYDPMGIVPPRGVDPAASFREQAVKYAASVALFMVLSFAAVVRSWPFHPPPHRRRVEGAGGR